MFDGTYRTLAHIARNESLLSGNVQEALQEILPIIAQTLKTERINFWHFDPNNRTLCCLCAYNHHTHTFSSAPDFVQATEGYWQVLQADRMIMIEDVRHSEYIEPSWLNYLESNGIGAMLDTLIVAENQVYGTLCCEHVGSARTWTTEEQLFLSAVANFLTIGLNNQKLHQEQQDTAHKKAMLRSVVENTDSLIWLLDSDYRLVAFNKPFSDSIKKYYRKSIYEGMPIQDISHDIQEKQRWQMRHRHAFAGNISTYNDLVVFNNRPYHWEISLFPIVENGVVRGISHHARDVSHDMRIRERLQRQNAELQRINHDLDEFVYRTSHDLRSPLASLLGLIDIIETEDDAAIQRNYLQLMRRSVSKLDESVREILQLSSNTRSAIVSAPIEIDTLVHELWNDLSFIEGVEKIDFRPQFHPHPVFYSDARRLGIVLSNLLSNAIRYHNLAQATPFIAVTIEPTKNSSIKIAITDNGQGISPEYISKVFEMFFRANTQRTGTGLGLYIVRETLQKLNGTISVSSELGVGTTFEIILENMPPTQMETENAM